MSCTKRSVARCANSDELAAPNHRQCPRSWMACRREAEVSARRRRARTTARPGRAREYARSTHPSQKTGRPPGRRPQRYALSICLARLFGKSQPLARIANKPLPASWRPRKNCAPVIVSCMLRPDSRSEGGIRMVDVVIRPLLEVVGAVVVIVLALIRIRAFVRTRRNRMR